jgi:hypothetical protein
VHGRIEFAITYTLPCYFFSSFLLFFFSSFPYHSVRWILRALFPSNSSLEAFAQQYSDDGTTLVSLKGKDCSRSSVCVCARARVKEN